MKAAYICGAGNHFGDLHGFIAGWCYWTNSLFYVPVLLVYIAGVAAFAGGDRWVGLVDDKWFVGSVAFGWLAFITLANIRGLGVGKWINNIGGAGGLVTVGAGGAGRGCRPRAGNRGQPAAGRRLAADMAGGLGVMCFAFIGIELASTMADEIRNPERDVPRSVVITGAIALVAYLLVADALLVLVPPGSWAPSRASCRPCSQGADAAGAGWLVAPIAVVMAISVGGSASAWLAGPARIPFVAGLDRALPAALGRVHPSWDRRTWRCSPARVISAALTGLSLAGSTVAEAYQVLLRAAVVINLVPFVYAFLALMTLDLATRLQRAAGAVGTLVTLAGIVAVFLPTGEVGDVWVFELKMAAGVGLPIARRPVAVLAGARRWRHRRIANRQSPIGNPRPTTHPPKSLRYMRKWTLTGGRPGLIIWPVSVV